jgi:hypothetical protein
MTWELCGENLNMYSDLEKNHKAIYVSIAFSTKFIYVHADIG